MGLDIGAFVIWGTLELFLSGWVALGQLVCGTIDGIRRNGILGVV